MSPSLLRPVPRLFAVVLALAGGLTGATGFAQDVRIHGSHSRDSYILSLGDHWMSSDVNFDELSASRLRMHGNYLWFRRGGKTWLVEDAPTLERAVKLFAPLNALEPEQDALREKEQALDDRETSLDDEEERIDAAMERLEPADADDEQDEDAPVAAYVPSPEDERERDELAARLDELHAKQRELQTEQRAFDREERALDDREEKLEREAEASLWKLIDETIANGTAKPAA
jgi:hypothetical protein